MSPASLSNDGSVAPLKPEVEIGGTESERPKRPWVTPGFARLELTNARAPGPHHTFADEVSGGC
jgi:hypothetical protein